MRSRRRRRLGGERAREQEQDQEQEEEGQKQDGAKTANKVYVSFKTGGIRWFDNEFGGGCPPGGASGSRRR